MYKAPWDSLKRANIKTPENFMIYLHSIVPNLSEEDIIKLRRRYKNELWLQQVCDFIWICMQSDREKWQPQINTFWPEIKQIMDAQNLEDAFSSLVI